MRFKISIFDTVIVVLTQLFCIIFISDTIIVLLTGLLHLTRILDIELREFKILNLKYRIARIHHAHVLEAGTLWIFVGSSTIIEISNICIAHYGILDFMISCDFCSQSRF